MTKAELKPCPFCRGKADPDGWLGSDKDGAPKSGPACDDCGAIANTIEQWNHRPTEQALVEALKMWKSRITGPTDHTMQDVLNATDQALEMAGAVE